MYCWINTIANKVYTLWITHRVGFINGVTVCVLFTFSACSKHSDTSSIRYYNIDSLLTAQINHLTQSKASVRKVAMMDTIERKTSFTPEDTTRWIKELEVFRDLQAINKPVNRGAYTVEEGVSDTKSNLKLKSFVSKTALQVAYLKIYYQHTLSKVRRIEAQYNENNSMYSGTRYLTLEFQEIKNTPILTYYAIDGGQKMFLGDSVQYTINASVSLPN